MLPEGFLAFINEHRLFTQSDRIVVAVSGGIDSMVLTDLLHQAGFSFAMAHVNFGLRESEADADAIFVENRARTYGVPFHLTRFDTLAEAAQRGESVQLTARRLRYNWFRNVQTQHGYVAVATAHHLNDVLETVLLNLTRGTGLAGLRGMPVRSALSETAPALVRPLWFTTRVAIEMYAQQRGLDWREDASNQSDKYSRNKLRHQVVPVLEEINPGLLQALPRSLSQLRAAETILKNDLSTSFMLCSRPADDGFVIDVTLLSHCSEPLFRLGEWLRPYGFTPDVLAQCWQAINPAGHVPGRNGQVFLAPAHQLLHDHGQLWLTPLRPAAARQAVEVRTWPTRPIELHTDGKLSVNLMQRAEWNGQWTDNQVTALLDADALPFPWTIRLWREGDRFVPLGMKGTRLISDFLSDNKLPLQKRQRVWVLESGGRIQWIVGFRVAQESRITENTRRIARLEWLVS